MNIRKRLTLLFTLLVASILLLFTITIYYFYNQFREQEFYQRLAEKALTTARLRQDVGEVPNDDLPVLSDEQVTIYDDRNQIVFQETKDSPTFGVSPGFLRAVREKKQIRMRRGDTEAVGLVFTGKNGQRLVIVTSANDRYGFSKLQRLRDILFFGWLFSLFVVGVAGWFFASDAIRPVSEIIAQVNAISATNIHQRLRVGRQRDELADLARTFNAMLRRLEDAFINQKTFVSYASHELRTPLAVMLGQTNVALMQPRSGAEYVAALETVEDEVRRLIDLSNGLLDLARANADVATIHYQPVRTDELLWQARANLIQKYPDYTIDIDFDNLPDQEDDLILPAEEPLLRTAFQNLMENGCKYSADHQVRVLLAFTASQLQLTFTDEGVGISANDLIHIFEPFYRAERTKELQGHGIGLALTQRIIGLHNGQIQIESEPGRGTSVTVIFPARQSVPSLLAMKTEKFVHS